jgi:zinc transport system ATP-binding protein
MDTLLDIRDVSFAYRRERPAVEGISLAVARGSTVAMIGPNGGGKTTLLRLILGQLEPTTGSILIDGMTPRQATRAGLVGYLPQSPQIATNVPIDLRQLVELGLAGRVGMLRGIVPADRAWVDELIGRVGMTDFAHASISELSGGQLQRGLIARALVARPRLLLLDEPTIGIDRRGQQAFIELLMSLRTSLGLTIVIVSHDLRAVTSISDRIACVSGKVHFHDVPQHLPAEVVYDLFACDLDALGLDGQRAALTPMCADPACDGHHHNPLAPVSVGTKTDATKAGER